MEQTDLKLVVVQTPDQWHAYHWMRRTVLFEPHGYAYDAEHPDDREPGNVPLLLTSTDVPIGTMRLDLDIERTAVFVRTMAIIPEQQRHGLGRAFLSLAEAYAMKRGCERSHLIAIVSAVGFYEKCGYREHTWDPDHPPPENERQMMRELLTTTC